MAEKNSNLPKVQEQAALKVAYIKAFVASGFIVWKALEAVGIKSRTTVWEWKKTDKDFADALIDAREQEGDWYENQLRTLSAGIPEVDEQGKLTGWKEKPDTTAVNSVLNAKFRDRGYGYKIRHEHEHSNKKESRIDLMRLSKEQRETWYELLDLATIPDDEITDAEIVTE